MAGLGFMSPFHFNRVFRHMTGIPPGLFQSALRLEAAKRLLLTTAMPLPQICEKLGFLSSATLARQFKAKVGVAPERLRRLARMIREWSPRLEDLLPAFADGQRPLAGVAGEIAAPEGFDGLIAVALFKKAAPEGWPSACALRIGPGTFVLPQMPDGSYHLLAGGLDRRTDIVAALVDGEQALRSNGRGMKILISRGRIVGLPENGIRLRPASPVDPPILFAFPALVVESLFGSEAAPRAENPIESMLGI